jgi:hypothetical protein
MTCWPRQSANAKLSKAQKATDLGDELNIEFDPPDTSPHTAGPLLIKAAWGEAIRGGLSRAGFVGLLRLCADRIEAMTDGQYTAGQYTAGQYRLDS